TIEELAGSRPRAIRMVGGAAYALLNIALHGGSFLGIGLRIWDVAAGIVIAREAGRKVRLWNFGTLVHLVVGTADDLDELAPQATGAASSAAASQPAGTAAAEAVKLVVWPRNYTLTQDPPFQPVTKEFEAAHPGLTVELSGAPYDPQFQRIELSQAGQVADIPDVIQLDNIWLGQFTEEGILANLDSYYAS